MQQRSLAQPKPEEMVLGTRFLGHLLLEKQRHLPDPEQCLAPGKEPREPCPVMLDLSPSGLSAKAGKMESNIIKQINFVPE